MKTGSNELIRDINSSLILETIIRNVTISRADISKKLGLTRATVSAITEDLKKQGLILEAGSNQSDLGRKAILFRLRQDHAYSVCVDLRPDTITILCADLLGQQRKYFSFPNDSDREHILQDLIGMIDSAINQYTCITEEKPTAQESEQPVSKKDSGSNLSKHILTGIVLAIHGTTFMDEVTFCPYLPYEGLPFSETLTSRFQVPVYLENEANLSAIGEHTFYFHKSSMIFVSVHSGIGMGIIFDNELFRGVCGKAGEFGHSIVERDGRPCPCGNHGCLEQYASEQAILKDFCQKKGITDCDREMFLQACREQDADALFILQQFETYMTICINNILNTFNPEVIVLNSFITTQMLDSLQRIRQGIHTRMKDHCVLLPSMLQDQAALLGGICMCTKNYLKLSSLDLTGYGGRP